VRILDVDKTDDGTPFMVMEYLHGSDLGALLKRGGRLPAKEAIGYVLQACEALAEAHAIGIVHRDLKPSNLFRAETARAEPVLKLLDFGISKLSAPGEDLMLTDTNAVIGSPLFMSPEQLLSSRDVDHRTDLWSIGITLYQLVSGALPFEASTASALGAQIAASAPRPLGEALGGVDPRLEAAVMCCLARAPKERFADVVALARALAPLVDDGASAVSAVERAAERGARGKPPVSSSFDAEKPAIVEASGERWTKSHHDPGMISGEGTRPPAAAWKLPAEAHATEATRDADPAWQPPIDARATMSRTSAPPRARSKSWIAIVAIVAIVIVVSGAALWRWRRPPIVAPAVPVASSSPSVVPAVVSVAPSVVLPSSTVTATSTTPSTKRVPPAKTWSKDPSELELK
jgi:hypothetical protein